MDWTPQEIFEYKQKWRAKAFGVEVHSDDEWLADKWVKAKLMKHRWNKEKYAGPYYHVYLFEHLPDAEEFVKYMKYETGERELAVIPPKEERKHW